MILILLNKVSKMRIIVQQLLDIIFLITSKFRSKSKLNVCKGTHYIIITLFKFERKRVKKYL